jgi:hypothetical protein
MRRNLSRSSRILKANIRIIRTPHMVFTNPIMTIHVNKTIEQPPMNSIVARGYKSIDVENPK